MRWRPTDQWLLLPLLLETLRGEDTTGSRLTRAILAVREFWWTATLDGPRWSQIPLAARTALAVAIALPRVPRPTRGLAWLMLGLLASAAGVMRRYEALRGLERGDARILAVLRADEMSAKSDRRKREAQIEGAILRFPIAVLARLRAEGWSALHPSELDPAWRRAMSERPPASRAEQTERIEGIVHDLGEVTDLMRAWSAARRAEPEREAVTE